MTKKKVILILLFFFLSYFLTSGGNTSHNYFTLLADSFLKGKYWLTENPPWLSELIPAGANKFYVVYPPMPAILAIPFVALFGKDFPQQYLAHILGAGIVILTMRLSLLIKKDYRLAIWSGILVGFGSIIWFLSSVGSSWYLGQITGAFFLTAALVEALAKKRSFFVGVFLGAAYLSRINIILAAPFIYFLMEKKIKASFRLVGLALGFAPFFLFNAFYNHIRFGVIWDKGYFLLPLVLNETNAPWFIKGVMHPSYILDNLRVAFWSFPKILGHFPYLQPSWLGMAIWLTTPAFIYSVLSPIKDRVTKTSWLAILIIFLSVAMHGGTGFAQFGYRFAVDFYPFSVLLTIKGAARTGLKQHHWLLLAAGVLVNLWGVIWINKFGWVSY